MYLRDEGGPSDRPFVVRVRLSCSLTSLTWVDRSKAVSVWRFCSIGTDGPTERRPRTAQEERRRRTYVVGEKEGEGGREGGRTRRGYARSHARAPHTRSVPRQGRRPPHGATDTRSQADLPTDRRTAADGHCGRARAARKVLRKECSCSLLRPP